MTFVVDASIAAAWVLPDKHNDPADRLLEALRTGPAHVPSLFWCETRSVFLVAEKRGRLSPGEAVLSMVQLRGLPLLDEGTGNDPLVLSIAGRHALSAYDATYLALAIERALPLATCDKKLAAAARMEGILLRGPLEANPSGPPI